MADVIEKVQTESQAPQEKEYKFPCKSCGSALVFEPGQADLKCPYCGHEEKIPASAEAIKSYSFNDYLAKPHAHGYGTSSAERNDLHCDGCGATVHFDASVRAATCPFCGRPLISGDAAANEEVIRPEALAPFAITARQAEQAFHNWIASLWFAPTALKRAAEEKQLHGVYRPFWTYDSHTASHWTGERGDYYYATETYTETVNGRSVTRTRQVRKIRWTFVSGVHNDVFADVLIPAGRDTDLATAYKLSGLKYYTPEYLSGFAAERYTVSCEDGWQQAKQVIADELQNRVRSEIGGDEQRVLSVDTAYSGIAYKHILLPLWLSSYRYGNKSYSFQVNGQTGEVAGHRPYSFWKIFFLAAAIGIAAAVIYFLTRK
jgi:predicted RNA-binding Zn-ribbon protein involved in translation (DUF1610 family)